MSLLYFGFMQFYQRMFYCIWNYCVHWIYVFLFIFSIIYILKTINGVERQNRVILIESIPMSFGNSFFLSVHKINIIGDIKSMLLKIRFLKLNWRLQPFCKQIRRNLEILHPRTKRPKRKWIMACMPTQYLELIFSLRMKSCFKPMSGEQGTCYR
jgi:hypothetical protein